MPGTGTRNSIKYKHPPKDGCSLYTALVLHSSNDYGTYSLIPDVAFRKLHCTVRWCDINILIHWVLYEQVRSVLWSARTIT
jgi:hypothetical protein